MPVYEYECTDCGCRFEQRRKATGPPASRCPECRGKVKRVYQPVGIIFRGSGFHVTDYGRTGDQPKKAGKTETEKAPAAAGAADTD
jgi:putative FmdB family regulatory protein